MPVIMPCPRCGKALLQEDEQGDVGLIDRKTVGPRWCWNQPADSRVEGSILASMAQLRGCADDPVARPMNPGIHGGLRVLFQPAPRLEASALWNGAGVRWSGPSVPWHRVLAPGILAVVPWNHGVIPRNNAVIPWHEVVTLWNGEVMPWNDPPNPVSGAENHAQEGADPRHCGVAPRSHGVMPWNHPANPGVGGLNPRPEATVLRNHGGGGRVRAVFPQNRRERGRSAAPRRWNDGPEGRDGRLCRSEVEIFSEVFRFG